MKKTALLKFAAVLSAAILITGCGSQAESSTEDRPAADSEGVFSSEQEASEPDISYEAPAGETQGPQSGESNQNMGNDGTARMTVQIGESSFTATLEENEAADALAAMMEQGPVTIQMRDYAGFEKVGALGTSLPVSDRHITAEAGDIVLYQGNQIVMFYGHNSWSYTRLARIDDLAGWREALGSGGITVTFSLDG